MTSFDGSVRLLPCAPRRESDSSYSACRQLMPVQRPFNVHPARRHSARAPTPPQQPTEGPLAVAQTDQRPSGPSLRYAHPQAGPSPSASAAEAGTSTSTSIYNAAAHVHGRPTSATPRRFAVAGARGRRRHTGRTHHHAAREAESRDDDTASEGCVALEEGYSVPTGRQSRTRIRVCTRQASDQIDAEAIEHA